MNVLSRTTSRHQSAAMIERVRSAIFSSRGSFSWNHLMNPAATANAASAAKIGHGLGSTM